MEGSGISEARTRDSYIQVTMGNQIESKKAPIRLATSCTECQRRKQKCSREWPCNHCQARRIAHLCKFVPKKAFKPNKPAARDASPKKSTISLEHEPLDTSNSNVASSDESFRALGYLPNYQNGDDDGSALENSSAVFLDSQESLSNEMSNALRVIPPKPYIDIIVQHFLNNTNYQYYALYPPSFLHDYSAWWSGKANGLPVTPEFTCLLLRVCSCSIPYLDSDIRQKLESELGSSIQHLSELYHNTAKQLSSTIAPGKGGLTQVQQLFLTAQWFKTEALFVESWHALGAAIHEAQELGLHKRSSNTKFSEFDREIRRRLWCILYAWDWQMSLLLSRPFIINTNYCSFELPNLRLEARDSQDDCPSPISHIVLQCQLGLSLSKLPGVMGGVIAPAQAISIRQETENWFDTFPPSLNVLDPDTHWDSTHSYLVMQRFQLQVTGYMVMLMPLKQCLTKPIDQQSASIEKSLLPTAIDCALKAIDSARQLLDHMLPLNAKFHFAPFLIFDTAAFLCSAILHDRSRSLPQRDQVVERIRMALTVLEHTSHSAKVGTICYNALSKLASGLSLISGEEASVESKTPPSSIGAPQTISDVQGNPDILSCFPIADSPNIFNGEFPVPTPFNYFPPDAMINGHGNLADFSQLDLEELGQIWDWGNLDLNFPTLI